MAGTRHIALLRGINLGARNRVSMPELRELLTRHGYEDVQTLLQSGNVVLTSDRAPDDLATALARQIADGLGVETPVVVRTREELADVIARDPFGPSAANPKRYQVTFLSGDPDSAAVRELEDGDFGAEQVVVSGREIYAWHPDGIQRSALARLLGDRKLGVVATARNWSTVTKLHELAAG